MDSQTIIKQLKKALSCKDDKEMRMRVEVVVDVLEQTSAPTTTFPAIPSPTVQVAAPTQALAGTTPNSTTPKFTMSKNGEQLNYERPAGT